MNYLKYTIFSERELILKNKKNIECKNIKFFWISINIIILNLGKNNIYYKYNIDKQFLNLSKKYLPIILLKS